MEILNFSGLTSIFRILALVQLALFFVLFFITLGFKLYHDQYLARQKKIILKINHLLKTFENLGAKDIQFLQKHRKLSFDTFFELDKQKILLDVAVNQHIITQVFLPYLHQDVLSTYWPLRNKAALLLQLKNKYFKSLSTDEENDLMILLNDSIPLVAVNAGIAVCFSPTQNMMDILIDVFSQKRRSQYDLLTAMLKEAALQVIPYIQKRLVDEKTIYVRVFCYRMLRHLPIVELEPSGLISDLSSENIDLSLAALAYVSYAQTSNFKEHLIKGMQSKLWEIRARAAKLIGYTKDENFVEVLVPYLQDEVWWVRYRAAEALSRMGSKGLNILKAQKLDVNKFAFKIAQQQLQCFYLKKIIL